MEAEKPTQYILLVISEGQHSTEGFHWCLHKAKTTGRKLRIAYVVNPSEAAQTSEVVKKTIDEAEKQCRTFQTPFETTQVRGDYWEECVKLAQAPDVDLVVVSEKKKGPLDKWLQKPGADSLKGKVQKEVKVY